MLTLPLSTLGNVAKDGEVGVATQKDSQRMSLSQLVQSEELSDKCF